VSRPVSAPAAGPALVLLPALVLALAPIPAAALLSGHAGTAQAIRTDAPGTHAGPCAELCGRKHARMAIPVIAESPAAFEVWLARQRELASAPAGAAARRGPRVLLGGVCVLCDAIGGRRP
jgi:cytochrome c oxidase subunit 2